MKTRVLFACWIALLPLAALAAAADARLVNAARNRDKEAVRSLLQQNVDVNAPQGDGATALSWASYWDDLEIAELLIRAGANANAANGHGVTPLSLACTNRSAPMVEKLLKAAANPNIAQFNGETPAMTCARTGNAAAVKLLIEAGARINVREPYRGHTVLMAAAAGKHSDVVQLLIEHGADVHARAESGFTSLMFAAQQGDLESARLLLAKGADVNQSTAQYGNSLTVASASHHEGLALFLLEKGADPNIPDGNGITALHYASVQGLADMTAAAPTSAYDNSYKVRPSNMRDLAKALLARGANPNAQIKKELVTFGTSVALRGPGEPSMINMTPFVLASLAADVELMRILLAGGADPKLAGRGNTTPLIAAAGGAWNAYRAEESESHALEAVKLIVELGADVNEANASGQTAVHAAAFTGADAIIEFLAAKGASLDTKTKTGETPWSMAEAISTAAVNNATYRVHKNTSELLVKLGARAMTPEEVFALRNSRFGGTISGQPEEE